VLFIYSNVVSLNLFTREIKSETQIKSTPHLEDWVYNISVLTIVRASPLL